MGKIMAKLKHNYNANGSFFHLCLSSWLKVTRTFFVCYLLYRKCVKIKSEQDEWYCLICENLNQVLWVQA